LEPDAPASRVDSADKELCSAISVGREQRCLPQAVLPAGHVTGVRMM
jgi:hypothetical protein